MRWVIAALLMAGLLLAGSDGPKFPWPNLAGVGFVIAAAWVSARQSVSRRFGR